MKKNLFMVAAVALMALVSCSKENIENNVVSGEASDIVFTAELEQPDGEPTSAPSEVQSKTSLGTLTNGVRPVSWVANDQIKINGITFKATSTGTRTDFTTTSSFAVASTYYAVYPATAAGASDLSKVTIPASQKGTFAEAAISVAKSSTQSLSFKNVASILKFQVPSTCSTITIESTSNLAGTFPVTFSNDLPVIGTVSSVSKKITLTGSFTTGKDYYVAVLPGSHKFTVRLDGYLSKASTTAVTTKRAVITNLKTLPAPTVAVYGIAGTMQTSTWNAGNPIEMYNDVNGTVIVKNIELCKGDEFKVVKDKSWNESYGDNGSNMKIGTYGTYDIIFDVSKKTITCTKINDNISFTVRFTFNLDTDNNKQWFTAANMYIWGDLGELLGKYPGTSMTYTKSKNTLHCDLPGKCVGYTISYKIGNPDGNWTTGDRSIEITRSGATVNGSSVGIQ